MTPWIRGAIIALTLAGARTAALAQETAPEAPSPTAHVHGAACGHYFYDAGWHDFPSAHVHSSSCGHSFFDGAWHLFPEGHEHSTTCGHFFYGGAWHVFAEGHIHGLGCGHEFADGEWRDPFPARPSAAESAPPAHVAAASQGRPAIVEPVPPPLPRLAPIRIVYRQDPRVYTFSAPVVVTTDSHHHGFDCGHYYYGGVWNDAPPACAADPAPWCRPEVCPAVIASPWQQPR